MRRPPPAVLRRRRRRVFYEEEPARFPVASLDCAQQYARIKMRHFDELPPWRRQIEHLLNDPPPYSRKECDQIVAADGGRFLMPEREASAIVRRARYS